MNGRGVSIGNEIHSFLVDTKKADLSELELINCDGTAVNTGYLNGAIVTLERALEKPLSRSVCQLHFAELLLEKAVQLYDGKSTKSDGLSNGPISQAIRQNIEEREINKNFQQIACPNFQSVVNSNIENLNTDQKHFIELAKAVMRENIHINISFRILVSI